MSKCKLTFIVVVWALLSQTLYGTLGTLMHSVHFALLGRFSSYSLAMPRQARLPRRSHISKIYILMHRWGAYVKFRTADGTDRTALLGSDLKGGTLDV